MPKKLLLILVLCCVSGIACQSENDDPDIPEGAVLDDSGYYVHHSKVQFLDAVRTNVETVEELGDLTFANLDGKQSSLREFFGEKNVVLVVTRGYTGRICVYCSTQTSRLISNYEEFAKRNTEIVVAFPIQAEADKDKLGEFVTSAREKLDVPVEKIPFPILLDVQLKAVDQLGIRGRLAKPATYILDKAGHVRFAYVGDSIAKRPSVKALLGQLDDLNAEVESAEAHKATGAFAISQSPNAAKSQPE